VDHFPGHPRGFCVVYASNCTSCSCCMGRLSNCAHSRWCCLPMLTKDCHVKIATFFFTTFPLAVFVFDVVIYGDPLFFFLHLLYGFLMYLVVEIIVRRRGFDCNTPPNWGGAYGFIFFVLLFRDFSWFGFSIVIVTTAMVLLPLFVLRPNQSEGGPRQQ